jgi:hypothetical protein
VPDLVHDAEAEALAVEGDARVDVADVEDCVVQAGDRHLGSSAPALSRYSSAQVDGSVKVYEASSIPLG